MLLRKFLDIEGDKPIDILDNATLEYENKTFSKKVVETMKRLKKPVVTANPFVGQEKAKNHKLNTSREHLKAD